VRNLKVNEFEGSSMSFILKGVLVSADFTLKVLPKVSFDVSIEAYLLFSPKP
jgi:hypothetical protein